MALSNTLYAGLSGLSVNQTKLSVVGNNIANVNSVAFKSTRAVFKPQFYVTDQGGTQPEDDSGGVNPSQRGLGTVVAALERNWAPGSIESTGRATDLAIDGEGFFIVRGEERRFTRDGTFKLNPANKLVTNSGEFIQGYGVDGDYHIVTAQITDITIPLGTLATSQATHNVRLSGNFNASGDIAQGASILLSQPLTTTALAAPDGSTLLTDLAATSNPATALFAVDDELTFSARKGGRELPEAVFTVTDTTTLGDLMTFFQEHLGINMDVPDDGNPATPDPGIVLETDSVDPTSVRMAITGNLGEANALALPAGSFITDIGVSPFTFVEGANAAGIESAPSGESIRTSFEVYDSLGSAVVVSVTAVLESTDPTGTQWRFYAEASAENGNEVVGMGTISFDSLGRYRSATGTDIAVPRSGTGAIDPLSISLDLSGMTALENRNSDFVMTGQDGSSIGRLNGFSIDEYGRITGTFSNGLTRTLGQVAMASFSNPQGLLDRGGNMFVEGANSGPAVIGAPGTLGTGKIVAGALELSNVDLSEEFINLIIASTGFTAASRVISTADQLITELLNSSR